MQDTSIAWCDWVWNPIRGCSRISAGCERCYAEALAARHSVASEKRPNPPFAGFAEFRVIGGRKEAHWTGKVELIESKLLEPLSWRRKALKFREQHGRKPRAFISMSDLFHESLPDEAIDRVMAVAALTPEVNWMFLTKRAERMAEYFQRAYMPGAVNDNITLMTSKLAREMFGTRSLPLVANSPGVATLKNGRWPLSNVALGVSVESQKYADERIPHLLATPAAMRFVSYEPALEAVDFSRFLAHNHFHDSNTGRDSIRSSSEGRFGNRRRGEDLESAQARMGQVEEVCRIAPMQESESRDGVPAVLYGGDDRGIEAIRDRRSPSSVQTLQGSNTDRIGDQPHRREQVEPSPGQPGGCDVQREHNTCSQGAWDQSQTRQPVGRRESIGKADGLAGGGDSSEVLTGGSHARGIGESVRSEVSADIQDSSRRAEIAAAGANSGLYESTPAQGAEKLTGTISLIIAGGESGPGARPFDIAWARQTVKQCRAAGVAPFVKQMGSKPERLMSINAALELQRFAGRNPDKPEPQYFRDRKGENMSEWPEDLRVREWPEGWN